jgi:hypothetical protein
VCAIVNAAGRIILQTLWAPAADLRFGPRRTRYETVADSAELLRRVGELAPAITWPSPPGALHC